MMRLPNVAAILGCVIFGFMFTRWLSLQSRETFRPQKESHSVDIDRPQPCKWMGGQVALCVLSSSANGHFRQAWRQYQVQALNDVGIDVRFFLDGQTQETEREAQEHGDVVFLPAGLKGAVLTLFQNRSLWAIDYILTQCSPRYEWLIRADDDSFWCGAHLRQEMDQFEEHYSGRALHWAHYTWQPYFNLSVSDVSAVYNRRAAEIWVKASHAQPPEQRGGRYMDLVDSDPKVWVIQDVRFCYGGNVSGEVNWQEGWIEFGAMSSCMTNRFCNDHLALHINIKSNVVRGIKVLANASSNGESSNDCAVLPQPLHFRVLNNFQRVIKGEGLLK